MGKINYRNATIEDVPFIVDIIIEAEKSGTNRLSYSTIFDLSEEEVRKYVTLMLEEEVEGSGELSISSYLLAEKDGKIIAGACAWVENSTEIPTSTLKGNLINFTIPRENALKAARLHNILHELHFDYKSNVIHMGAGYVAKESRGKGLLLELKQKQLNDLAAQNSDIEEAYVDTFECSKAALRTSEKLGFKLVEIKEATSDEILKYLPSKRKFFLKKNLKTSAI